MTIILRVNEPSEAIDFHAHAGVCRYCDGVVKMERDFVSFALVPDACRCLRCGQPYHVVTPDLVAWERQQWREKEGIMEFREKPNPLIGQTVTAVFLAEDKGALRFDLDGGDSLVVRADGDCCSHSWIEHIQGVEQLIGSPVVSVEDIGMPDRVSGNRDDEVVAYYGCKITTEQGFAVIDYRNESNGYYGGSLVWPGEYFYGGVFGQNVSKEDWREVTA